ncbi:MAG: DUF6088 family protein [Gammaproteobacteria bacterium]|nr:DUF6088 family protein [Gammaproteobacteria bacterium]
MSTATAIRIHIQRLPKGRPFTTSCFTSHGSRGAVDRALSRIVHEGEIERLCYGVFVRPRESRFVGTVLPAVEEVLSTIAAANGETIQIHGAEAVRRLGLTTQVPTALLYHTSASSRTIHIASTTVKLIHTSNWRRLQFAGEAAGLALAALWYLGKDNVTPKAIGKIRSAIGKKEFKKLRSANVPAWMAAALVRAKGCAR